METSGIYIHIPFCKVKCIYCDFYSITDKDDKIEQFVHALVNEIETCKTDTTNWNFDTIFIGGGTPSLLSPQQLERILSALDNKFDLSNIVEFTLEANPGEASKEKLMEFNNLGVNRLSIGVQSFQSNLLHFLSRIHSVEDVFQTFHSARDANFNNINCDLIYNVPGQTLLDWKDDLSTLVKLNPEHISAYSLTVERNTKLFELVQNKSVKLPKEVLHKKFNDITYATIKDEYFQYEISNYSKLNKECLHNLHYWENYLYLGFGPSAHGYDGNTRWNNYSNLDKYISSIKIGKSSLEISYNITEIDKINEIIGFGLRMNKGFSVLQIPIHLKFQFLKQLKRAITKFPEMIIQENNRIKLSHKGFLFADAIAVELLFL